MHHSSRTTRSIVCALVLVVLTLVWAHTPPAYAGRGQAGAIDRLQLPHLPPHLLETATSVALPEDSAVVITILTDVQPGPPPSLTAHNLPPNAEFADSGEGLGVLIFHPDYDQAGDYVIPIVATSGLYADTMEIHITVTNVNRRPHAQSIGAIVLDEGQSLMVALMPFDPDGDSLIIRIDGPDFVELKDFGGRTDSVVFAPSYDDSGFYEVAVIVSDYDLADTQLVACTITNMNRAPVLNSIVLDTIDAFTVVTIPIEAVDPDGDPIQLSAPDLPAHAEFSDWGDGTGVIRLSPTDSRDTTYTFRVTAADGSDADTLEIEHAVRGWTNKPPQFVDLPGTIQAVAPMVIAFTVHAVDDQSWKLKLSAPVIPPGASFVDQGGGYGHFSYQAHGFGTWMLMLIASDGELADTAEVQIVLPHGDPIPDLQPGGYWIEPMESYDSRGTVDQIRVADVDYDGTDEVLIRETLPGEEPALRVWSPSHHGFLNLWPKSPGIKGYSLRAGPAGLDPVLWTTDNEIVVPDGRQWLTIDVIPDSAVAFHWLPENPDGWQYVYLLQQEVHATTWDPDTVFFYWDRRTSTDIKTSKLVFRRPNGEERVLEGGEAFADFVDGTADPAVWRQEFVDGELTRLLCPSRRYISNSQTYETPMGTTSEWSIRSSGLLHSIDAGSTDLNVRSVFWDFEAGMYHGPYFSRIPELHEVLVGLGTYYDSTDQLNRLAHLGPEYPLDYTPVSSWQLRQEAIDDGWSETNRTFSYPLQFRHGAIVAGRELGGSVMLATDTTGSALLLGLPDGDLKQAIALLLGGPFQSGYVYDTEHRDIVRRVYGSDIWIERLRRQRVVPRARVHRVPDDFATIQEAVDAAQTGDTVIVGPGEYHERIDYGTKGIAILSSHGPAQTVLVPPPGDDAVNMRFSGFAPAAFCGFTVIGGQRNYCIVVGTECQATIADNWFKDHDIGSTVLSCYSKDARIAYNLFAGNQADNTIGIQDSAVAQVINNTIVKNNRGIFNYGAGSVIANNLIVDCAEYGVHAPVGTIDYNIYWNNPKDRADEQTPVGAHEMHVYPQFVDPHAGNYALLAGSPAIDAGDPDPAYNDPDGSRNDMGAFPFDAVAEFDFNSDGLVDVRDFVAIADRLKNLAADPGSECTSALTATLARLQGHLFDTRQTPRSTASGRAGARDAKSRPQM